jgi:hypothetical protein
MALPNDISKIGQIANAVYNSVTANNTAITGMTINGTAVLPTLTYGYRRNRIINGSMIVDQRNAGASFTPTSGQFLVDRWGFAATQTSKFTAGQNLNSATTLVGYPKYMGFQSSSTYSVLAGDAFSIYQPIEGNNFADLGFGTASAQTVTISFVVYSSLIGSFGGVLKNFASNRSYPFSYSIPTANTWTSISVTIPGDTSGTWVGSTNAGAAYVQFGLGVGSTYSGTAGAWATGDFIAPTSSVSVVGTSGATFYISGVQLEAGSLATPFERLLIGETLMLCQRYFEIINVESIMNEANLTGNYGGVIRQYFYKVTKRASPSYTLYSGLNLTGTAGVLTTPSPGATSSGFALSAKIDSVTIWNGGAINSVGNYGYGSVTIIAEL